MIYSLYAVRDNKTGFLSLMQDLNDQSAMRNFEHAVLGNEDSLFFSHPQDYALFRLGQYDSDSGKILALALPECLLEASTVLSKALSRKGGISDAQGK